MDKSLDNFIVELHILLSAFSGSDDRRVEDAINLLRPTIDLILDEDGKPPPSRRKHLRVISNQ